MNKLFTIESRLFSTTIYHLFFVKLDVTAFMQTFFEVEISIRGMFNHSHFAS